MKRETRRDLIVVGALFAGSLVLRLVRLNSSLWYDEILTYDRFVTMPWGKIVTTLIVPNNHILYTLLAKLCVTVFGRQEWALRLPAVIAGVLTPPVGYLIFRRRVKFSVALLAGIFLTVSFWMVWFSQDARAYSSLVLFSLLGQGLYLDWLDKKRKSTLTWYLLAAVVGSYFYFYNGFIISGQVIFGFFKWIKARKERSPLIFILPVVALVLSASLYLPVVMDMDRYLDAEGRDIAGRWLDVYFLKELTRFLAGTRSLPLAVLMVALFLTGLARLWKRWPEICILYLLPAGLLVAFTWVMHVFIYARFLSFLIPFFFLSLASAPEMLETFTRRVAPPIARLVPALVVAGVLAVMAFSLSQYYKYGKQDFKGAAEYIFQRFPGRAVISFGLANQEFLYYDPTAQPWPGKEKLYPPDIADRMIVASFPWSWSAENVDLIRQTCHLESEWPSAGYEENYVYLFRCF